MLTQKIDLTFSPVTLRTTDARSALGTRLRTIVYLLYTCLFRSLSVPLRLFILKLFADNTSGLSSASSAAVTHAKFLRIFLATGPVARIRADPPPAPCAVGPGGEGTVPPSAGDSAAARSRSTACSPPASATATTATAAASQHNNFSDVLYKRLHSIADAFIDPEDPRCAGEELFSTRSALTQGQRASLRRRLRY